MRSKFLPITDLELQIKSLVPNNKFFVLPIVREFTKPDKRTNILYYGTFREEINVFNSLLSEDPILIDTTPTLFSHIEPDKIAYFQGYEIIFATSIFEPVQEIFPFYIGGISTGNDEIYLTFYTPVRDDIFSLFGSFDNGVTKDLIFGNIAHQANIGDFESSNISMIDTLVNFNEYSQFFLKNEVTEEFTPIYFYEPQIEILPAIYLALSDRHEQYPQFYFIVVDYPPTANFLLQKSTDGVNFVDLNIPSFDELTQQDIMTNVVQPNVGIDDDTFINCKVRVFDALNLITSNELLYGQIQPVEPNTANIRATTTLTQLQYNQGLSSYVDFINSIGIQERKYISFIAVFEDINSISIVNYVNCTLEVL